MAIFNRGKEGNGNAEPGRSGNASNNDRRNDKPGGNRTIEKITGKEPAKNEAESIANDEPGNRPDAKSSGTKIPEELINSFKHEYFGPDPYNPSGGPGNENETEEHFKQLNQVVNYGLSFVDDILKRQNLPGLGDQQAIKLKSELAVLVAERNIPKEALEKSPEYFLALLIGGDIVTNALAAKNAKPKNDKK